MHLQSTSHWPLRHYAITNVLTIQIYLSIHSYEQHNTCITSIHRSHRRIVILDSKLDVQWQVSHISPVQQWYSFRQCHFKHFVDDCHSSMVLVQRQTLKRYCVRNRFGGPTSKESVQIKIFRRRQLLLLWWWWLGGLIILIEWRKYTSLVEIYCAVVRYFAQML